MFSMAVVTFIVRARLAGMNRQLEEASADLGANSWRTFRDVTLPIAAPGVFAGALMSFTLSLDNTILSSFVQLPGSTPWPVYIFAAVEVALRPEIAAVSTLRCLLTLAALGGGALALRRTGGSSTEIIKTMAGWGSRRKRHVPSWAVPSNDRCADRPRGRKRYDMDVQ